MDEHGAELHADLLQYYHLDLVEWLGQPIRSPAPVLSLVFQLPEGSRYLAAIREKDGGKKGEWAGVTPEYILLAHIFDAINLNTACSGNFKKRPKFEPWPLPGRKKRRGIRDFLKNAAASGIKIRDPQGGADG